MNATNNGGPAFPNLELRHTCGDPIIEPSTGMSLRAYFAAKAMNGILMNNDLLESVNRQHVGLGLESTEFIALSAVGFADALIAALNSPKEDAK